ncbi:hypothetical protein HED60_00080 [Planctomycetales bacterium ZRK34]|nr:hypothetical protein HED60_00080 [Planctomycetales bacterium ZRK34]
MDEVSHQIAKLQRSVRRQRLLIMAIGLMFVGTLLMGQNVGGVLSTVRARKLLIYNDRNEIVFMVGSDKQSGKGVWQLIEDNKTIASCFSGKWGGSIQLSKQGEFKTGLLLVGDRDGYGSTVVWGDDQSIKWQAP